MGERVGTNGSAASLHCLGVPRLTSWIRSSSTDAMIGQVDRALLQLDRYQRGDLVVIVA
jgi:hypothetical protein